MLATFLFSFYTVNSQTIQGKVFDEKNLPLEGVAVYFDGTTLGTTTSSEGNFELKLLDSPTAILVISFIGYETIFLNSFQKTIEIKLKPSEISLDEVLLEPIPFTRKEMLKVFREQFLGQTKSGKKCIILNEEAIQFFYDSKDFKLSAFADETLKIENPYLGYQVEFNLMNFMVMFTKRTLAPTYLQGSFFAGTSFFKENQETSQSIYKNRNRAYLGSSKHFFKNLINHKWGKNEFLLFEGSMATDPNLHFEITPENNLMKIKVLIEPTFIDSKSKPKYYKRFQLLYANKEQSSVIFKVPFFYVDSFGNYTDIDQIDFTGEMAKKRVGDMLPTNYNIENNSN